MNRETAIRRMGNVDPYALRPDLPSDARLIQTLNGCTGDSVDEGIKAQIASLVRKRYGSGLVPIQAKVSLEKLSAMTLTEIRGVYINEFPPKEGIS